MSSERLPNVVVPLVVVSSIAVFALGAWNVSDRIDDAFIAYRYSDHLAHGHGLVYNIGERVEGFTSLAWVVLVAVGVGLGFSAPAVSHLLAIAFGALALVATHQYAALTLEPGRRWVAAIAPWMLLSSTAFSYWATSGLESPLYVAAVTTALLFAARGRYGRATIAACVATLARPEGVFVALVVLAQALPRLRWKRFQSWRLPLAYGAFVALLTAFRFSYFGAPLPNTFYAKVGDVPAGFTIHYVASFVIQEFAPLALPFFIGFASEPRLRPAAAWTAIVFVTVGVVGADFADHARFFLPALPAVIALATRGLAECVQCRSFRERLALACMPVSFVWLWWGALPGVCALVVAAAFAAVAGGAAQLGSWVGTAAIGAFVAGGGAVAAWPEQPRLPLWLGGRYFPGVTLRRGGELARLRKDNAALTAVARMVNDRLDRRKPEVRSVAALAIGVLGYESSRRVIDVYGLTDSVIARTKAPTAIVSLPGHQRSNPDHVFASKPDCILVPRERTWLPVAAHLDILAHPELRRSYGWDSVVGAYCLE